MATPKEAKDYFKSIAQRTRNMEPITKVVAEETKKFVDSRFNGGIDIQGNAFLPLSQTTIEINPRRAGKKPLTDTGRLKRSLRVSNDKRGINFEKNAIYTDAQNYGNPNNRVFGGPLGPIPPRPFIPARFDGRLINGGDAGRHWRRMKEIIKRWLLTGEK